MENEIYNTTNLIETNEVISTSDNVNILSVCTKMYTILSCLTFVIIIIFLFKYLKSTFHFRR